MRIKGWEQSIENEGEMYGKGVGRDIGKGKGTRYLKGLGHAILGNFSTDRMVIELTKISK